MAKFRREDIRRILGDAWTEDIENQIMALHLGVTDGLKDDLAKARADADKLPEVQKQLQDALDAAKDGGDLAKLQKEFDDYRAEVQSKETRASKEKAYRELLRSAGISEKRLDAVLKVTDLEAIELDKDGNIKGADNLTESIKSEWSDFIVTESTQGAKTANPPASTGTARKTKDEIYAIKDPAERQKAILENHDLFGI